LIDVYDAATGAFLRQIDAFEGFAGGVRVAAAVFGGQDVVIAAAGAGGFPLVRVFRASDGVPILQFEAFDHTFAGGVFVAVGDLDGDGTPEVVTGADADPNGFALVTVHDMAGQQISPNILAFDPSFKGGVRVAVGDFAGMGQADIAAAAGASGFPLVQILDGRSFTRSGLPFEVFDHNFAGGVFVAAAMLDASGLARLLVGAGGGDGGTGDEPVLRVFGADGTLRHDYVTAFGPGYHGGITVGTSRAFGRTSDVVLAGPAQEPAPARAGVASAGARIVAPLTPPPQVLAFDAGLMALTTGSLILDPDTGLADANFAGGVFVG
jgi:hypothetical protein